MIHRLCKCSESTTCVVCRQAALLTIGGLDLDPLLGKGSLDGIMNWEGDRQDMRRAAAALGYLAAAVERLGFYLDIPLRYPIKPGNCKSLILSHADVAGTFRLPACLPACLPVCLSVYLSVCPLVCLPACVYLGSSAVPMYQTPLCQPSVECQYYATCQHVSFACLFPPRVGTKKLCCGTAGVCACACVCCHSLACYLLSQKSYCQCTSSCQL